MPSNSKITATQETLTVSQLNQSVKKWLELEFPKIWVEGEISNFKRYPSGHMYFSLKDDKAQINCVMFAGFNRHLKFTPENGQHIKLKAKVTLYPERGQYQLIVDYMEEAGDGALKRAFEILKQQLLAEGLFKAKHKQALPTIPNCIGIVTSAKGAAIRDVLTTLKRRFPSIPVIIYPSLVQGNTAPHSIVQAIETANHRNECDVLIVGRGGGSLEDLQAFNNEQVARAIFASQIPVVSAVGHEVDVTIADFVADMRAPTPTAAAELVSPSQTEYLNQFAGLAQALLDAIMTLIDAKRTELSWLRKALKDPRQQLQEKMQRVDLLNNRLILAMQHQVKHQRQQLLSLQHQILQHHPKHQLLTYLQQVKTLQQRLTKSINYQLHNYQQQLSQYAGMLNSLSPLQTLARGYAIVKDDAGKIISDTKHTALGDKVTTQLAKGSIVCTVNDILD